MTSNCKRLTFPRTAPYVMRTVAAANSDVTRLRSNTRKKRNENFTFGKTNYGRVVLYSFMRYSGSLLLTGDAFLRQTPPPSTSFVPLTRIVRKLAFPRQSEKPDSIALACDNQTLEHARKVYSLPPASFKENLPELHRVHSNEILVYILSKIRYHFYGYQVWDIKCLKKPEKTLIRCDAVTLWFDAVSSNVGPQCVQIKVLF